uniref:Uncharacterized protein n=1 Tax=Arundo donax TaxID=35708 RepID=A0A0A9FCK7_ARUDO
MMMMNADVVNGNKDSDSRSGTSTPEWWPVMQEALATGVDLCNEEMLAAYLGVSSISLYSPSYSPSASGHYTDPSIYRLEVVGPSRTTMMYHTIGPHRLELS